MTVEVQERGLLTGIRRLPRPASQLASKHARPVSRENDEVAADAQNQL